MAEPDWILERERRQMEQILELDMEELQVEEVDDADSSSSSDVDTFLRSQHTPRPSLTISLRSILKLRLICLIFDGGEGFCDCKNCYVLSIKAGFYPFSKRERERGFAMT